MFLKAQAIILNAETKKREFKTILIEIATLPEDATTEQHADNYFQAAKKANEILTDNGKHIMTGWSNEMVNAELWPDNKLLVETKHFSQDWQSDIEIIAL